MKLLRYWTLKQRKSDTFHHWSTVGNAVHKKMPTAADTDQVVVGSTSTCAWVASDAAYATSKSTAACETATVEHSGSPLTPFH